TRGLPERETGVQWDADRPHRIECVGGGHAISLRGRELGLGEEGERALVGRIAGVRERERLCEMCRCRCGVARIGVETAEETARGDEGERLAGLGSMRQRLLGMYARLYRITRLPTILRPQRVSLGLSLHRAAPCQPAVVRIQPGVRAGQVTGIERQRRRL